MRTLSMSDLGRFPSPPSGDRRLRFLSLQVCAADSFPGLGKSKMFRCCGMHHTKPLCAPDTEDTMCAEGQGNGPRLEPRLPSCNTVPVQWARFVRTHRFALSFFLRLEGLRWGPLNPTSGSPGAAA